MSAARDHDVETGGGGKGSWGMSQQQQQQQQQDASQHVGIDATTLLRKASSERYHAERLQIVFRNITYSVSIKQKGVKGKVQKQILRDVSGVMNPGKLTFVMGASGAGKTTLLNVLAGYTLGKSEITGSIKVNGTECSSDQMRRISGFVHQEDVIMDTMTVREVLLFASQLKLPSSMSSSAKAQRGLDVAELLSLQKSLDNCVGSATLKGISGGEKRRLSLGMVAVTNPSILYLDEPTSGLDSATAYRVTRILAHLAHHYNRTIVCTIHQPSSDIFHLADNLLVLAEGQVMYNGAVEAMVPYFSSLGYHCPTYTNPADFLFREVLHAGAEEESQYDLFHRDAVSAVGGSPGSPSKGQGEGPQELEGAAARHEAEMQRIQGVISAWEQSDAAEGVNKQLDGSDSSSLSAAGISKTVEQGYAPFLLQCRLLADRAARNSWRNQLILKAKIAQTIFLSLVVGLIYLNISDDLTGVQDRQGSLFFIVVQGLFGSLMGTLTVFGAEKAVFQREYMSHMYGLFPYFASRWLVELPSRIVLPLLSCVIMYWMIGYQNTAPKFWWFALINILMDNCGASIGLLVSCMFNDINVALSVMPMFLLPLMVFSGFFVNSDSIPPYFWWIQWISPMKYGFTALAINEFSGLVINCTPEQGCAPGYNGDTVLSNLGFDSKGSLGMNAGILFAIMIGSTCLAYLALWVAVRSLRTTKSIKNKTA